MTLFFLVSLFFSFVDSDNTHTAHNDTVSIELINAERLDFSFTVEHKKFRNQIHVKSDEPLRSLRLVDGSKNIKTYKSIGSNLVVLPMTDFTTGDSHFIEVKFINFETVVMAKVTVAEDDSSKIH